jgi:hypothetical protein
MCMHKHASCISSRPKGISADEEVLARLSPYLTAHINRFGQYALNFHRQVPPPDYTLLLQALAA